MSDTPRTDDFEKWWKVWGNHVSKVFVYARNLECEIYETQEELAVTALDGVKHGELWFQFVDGLALYVDVYRATRWEGEAIETPEAIPLWTPLNALPFEEMWTDDRHWLAEMLIEKKHFVGKFLFDDDTMLTTELEWL